MSEHIPNEPAHILLVEDNPGDVRLTQEAFASVESEIVFHVVTDGKEATEYFQLCQDESDPDPDPETPTPHPDLVLLDLNLPRVDGFRVLELLETNLDYPPPPVLVLSSSETDADISKSYEKAANAYLTKPDDLTEFNAMASAIEEFWLETAHHPPTPS